MTVRKTDEDLNPQPERKEPELVNADRTDPTVKKLLEAYPKALKIEKLPSGNYSVRFRKKRAKWVKG